MLGPADDSTDREHTIAPHRWSHPAEFRSPVVESADIAHLLRRTEFVAKPGRVSELLALGSIEAAVDNVVDFTANGTPQLPAAYTYHDEAHGWDQFVSAYNWWIDSMRSRPRPLQEKMTLFWHGHFTSSWWDGIGRTDHMMNQNQLYRTMALGNFRELTQAMAVEPAMLVYLSNAENRAGSPNQNFARELMELFTLGVGNYTEDDVEAAARAWTGYNADWPEYTYAIHADRHDNGYKTFFGTTKNWSGPDIIDEILRDNPGKRLIAARFITKKLWDFFAHPGGPANVINELADVFIANDMALRPLMAALLKRPEFYSTAAKQGLVRTPTEWLVALTYHTNIAASEFGGSWMGDRMGQSLYNPPNVAGWKHNSYWMNTSALSARADIARGVTWRLRDAGGFDNVYAMSVPAAVDHVAAYFGMTSLSDATRNALISAHSAERAAVPWDNWWGPTNLLTMTMLAPEFHMA
jgi:uncharacterized protein (DUF1800 family)